MGIQGETVTYVEKGRGPLRDTTWVLRGDELLVHKKGSPDTIVSLTRLQHVCLERHRNKGGPYHQLVLTSSDGQRWFISTGNLPWWRSQAKLDEWQRLVRLLLNRLASLHTVRFQAGSGFVFYSRLTGCLFCLVVSLYQFDGQMQLAWFFAVLAAVQALDLPGQRPREFDPRNPPADLMGSPASGLM